MSKKELTVQINPLMMSTVLVSTASADGIVNLCSIAWITRVNSKPPLLVFGIGPHKKTYQNISETRCFGINIPDRSLIPAIDYCGLHTGNTLGKDSVLAIEKGQSTGVPLIKACKVQMECTLWQVVETPKNHLIIGEIKAVYADEELLDEHDGIDIYKMDPVLHAMAGSHIYFSAGPKTDDAYQKRSLSEVQEHEYS
jgi:flavin reductase (DIM6/NTAB) family NADH-FMN oxidoreductase RutF